MIEPHLKNILDMASDNSLEMYMRCTAIEFFDEVLRKSSLSPHTQLAYNNERNKIVEREHLDIYSVPTAPMTAEDKKLITDFTRGIGSS